MTTENLIKHLNRLKVQTGSLVCLGCGHEHNCGLYGCEKMVAACDEACRVAVRIMRKYLEENKDSD